MTIVFFNGIRLMGLGHFPGRAHVDGMTLVVQA